jgi:hypothetical protein
MLFSCSHVCVRSHLCYLSTLPYPDDGVCVSQGPFVHLSSIIAHQMSKLITTVNQLYAVSHSLYFMIRCIGGNIV